MSRKHDSASHVWTRDPRNYWDHCKVCGIVRRKEDKNSLCNGPTRLRPMEEVHRG